MVSPCIGPIMCRFDYIFVVNVNNNLNKKSGDQLLVTAQHLCDMSVLYQLQ